VYGALGQWYSAIVERAEAVGIYVDETLFGHYFVHGYTVSVGLASQVIVTNIGGTIYTLTNWHPVVTTIDTTNRFGPFCVTAGTTTVTAWPTHIAGVVGAFREATIELATHYLDTNGVPAGDWANALNTNATTLPALVPDAHIVSSGNTATFMAPGAGSAPTAVLAQAHCTGGTNWIVVKAPAVWYQPGGRWGLLSPHSREDKDGEFDYAYHPAWLSPTATYPVVTAPPDAGALTVTVRGEAWTALGEPARVRGTQEVISVTGEATNGVLWYSVTGLVVSGSAATGDVVSVQYRSPTVLHAWMPGLGVSDSYPGIAVLARTIDHYYRLLGCMRWTVVGAEWAGSEGSGIGYGASWQEAQDDVLEAWGVTSNQTTSPRGWTMGDNSYSVYGEAALAVPTVDGLWTGREHTVTWYVVAGPPYPEYGGDWAGPDGWTNAHWRSVGTCAVTVAAAVTGAVAIGRDDFPSAFLIDEPPPSDYRGWIVTGQVGIVTWLFDYP
jgi:hypothetical protein